MLFANPVFLFALTAISIPIIVHLYNFRRYRKVYFTNVRFISEIQQESKKRSQLKHLLILLMRILAILCLVFAFAQPYIPSPTQQRKLAGRQSVSIYIDNSFSMEALATNGKLLDVAKTRAREILSAYKPSDLFQLLTSDFEGRHQRFVSSEEFISLLDEITFSPVFRRLPEVLSQQEEMLTRNQGGNRTAYIISDFQVSSSDLSKIKADTSISWFFVPVVAEKSSNLYIDTAWFMAPSQQAGQAVQLNVKFRNNSPESLEKIPVRVMINNSQKAVASFSIEANGETSVTLPFTNNDHDIQYGNLEITDYPVTWDDKFYFSYPITQSVPVLCINGDKPNRYLEALFGNDSTVVLKNVIAAQLDYSSFSRFPLIILNGVGEISSGLSDELEKFIRQGGNLLLLPAPRIDALSYNTFLASLQQPLYGTVDTTRQKASDLNVQCEIYKDVFERNASGRLVLPENIDMPAVLRHYIIRASSTSGIEPVLKMQNGDLFLAASKVGKGKLFLCSVPLDDSWSSFPKHTLFIPTFYRIAILSEAAPSLYHYLGSNEPIEITDDTVPAKEVYKIRKLDTGFEFIPETRSEGGRLNLLPHDQVKEAGLYQVTEGNRIIQGLAFNYDRHESDMTCYLPDQLMKGLKESGIRNYSVMLAKNKPITRQIHEMSQGTPLWKLFIVLTLFFIAAEIAIIRLVKE
jgi:hypothetical protein